MELGNLVKGRIYVMRMVDGKPTPLALYHQTDYKEWQGCFTAL